MIDILIYRYIVDAIKNRLIVAFKSNTVLQLASETVHTKSKITATK